MSVSALDPNSNQFPTNANSNSMPSIGINMNTDSSTPTSLPDLMRPVSQDYLEANLSTLANLGNSTDTNSWYELPKMDSLVDVFSLFCSIAVIFGGLVPYIPQYLKIKKTANSDGFSTYVCLTLLLANILRIMFWFGHNFELPLLIQSFVMIVGMLAMMDICIRVKRKNSRYTISSISVGNQRRRRAEESLTEDSNIEPARPVTPIATVEGSSYSSDSSIEDAMSQSSLLNQQADRIEKTGCMKFWDWEDHFSYVKFLSLFTIIVGVATYLLRHISMYVETIGFVAVFTESMLGMPQLFRNHVKKSTKGMSVEMVVMWLSGDLFKTSYFIIRKTPAQFYVCGTVQVIVDILILVQVFWYRRPNATYRKLPKST